uniref:Alkylglycerone-phosphate synthase n=1 Tax=Macrostomum lignano TaxID=282301 RepID=A0A1I8FP74_9PLAT
MPDEQQKRRKPSGSDKETAKDSVFKRPFGHTEAQAGPAEMERLGLSGLAVCGHQSANALTFTGQRYQLSGSEMPALISCRPSGNWACRTRTPGRDRLFRGHGHTLEEMFTLREGMFPRLPDLVVWPTSHREVVELVNLANRCGVVLIPFGGAPPSPAPCFSLDTSQMNRILWLDERNLIGRFEAGIIGQDLEARLAELGYCIGHEPDSLEFSSLGGWKNVYGNIEDLLVHVTFVTPTGVIEKSCAAPRVSVGPDVHHSSWARRASLGVVTEVTLKIRPLPQTRRYGSLVFADFASGVRCLRELALRRCAPASVRLMDNEHSARPAPAPPPAGPRPLLTPSSASNVTRVRGFKPDELAVATLLYEGTPEEVAQ